MKRRGSVAAAVFQVLAILMLIVAIPSTVFYFGMDHSLNRALASDTVPELFGYRFVPVESDSVSKILEEGSLAVLSELDARDVTKKQVILYETSADQQENLVYENYAISTVQEINYGATWSYTVKSYEHPDVAGVEVSSSSLRGEVTWSIAYLGTLCKWVLSPYGLLCFVIIPCGLFLLLQLISVLIRVLGRPDPEEEDDREEVEQLLAEMTVEQQPAPSTVPTIQRETVSSMNSQISPYQALSSQTKRTAATISESPTAPMEELSVKKMPESQEKFEAFQKGNYRYQQMNPSRSDSNWQDRTTEFDMATIRERLWQKEVLKDLDEQEFIKTSEHLGIVDKILIEMKENSVDFSFKNIRSDQIQIEQTPTEDGFVIHTPNYEATIRVDIHAK